MRSAIMLQCFMKSLFSILALAFFISADELSDYQKKQAAELEAFRKQQNAGVKEQQAEFKRYLVMSRAQFAEWQKKQEEEYNAFRKSIRKKWGSFIEPSNKKWVEYSKDAKTVAAVDFEKGTVTVEAIKMPGETPEEVRKQIENAVVRVAESKGSMTAAPVEAPDTLQTILTKPLLQDQVTLANGQAVNSENVKELVKETAANENVVPIENGEGKEKIVFTFLLTPDHLIKRMTPYLPLVKNYCEKHGVDAAHVLATIHTESYFNPAARSSCGALGLMQLVPEKGAADAYRKLEGKDLVPSASYLFDPEKNIELGCVYINLLQANYFVNVKNKSSNTFCSIAGYNTGAGNVAFAFTGKRELGSAVSIINTMEDKDVYSLLLQKLPYAETRDYLKKVVERMSLYR